MSVRIAYRHGNCLIICLTLAETEILYIDEMTKVKLKHKQTLIANVSQINTAIFPTPLISHCTLPISFVIR
jgi:hypothetical protein